jgi:hypothetical protein
MGMRPGRRGNRGQQESRAWRARAGRGFGKRGTSHDGPSSTARRAVDEQAGLAGERPGEVEGEAESCRRGFLSERSYFAASPLTPPLSGSPLAVACCLSLAFPSSSLCLAAAAAASLSPGSLLERRAAASCHLTGSPPVVDPRTRLQQQRRLQWCIYQAAAWFCVGRWLESNTAGQR